MNFEDMVFESMGKDVIDLKEGFFKRPNPVHTEVQHQLSSSKTPAWVHKKLQTLSNPDTLNKVVHDAPLSMLHPQMINRIKNIGDTVKDYSKDQKVELPIILHNTRTDEMHILSGKHRLTTNSLKVNRSTPVILLKHDE